MAEDLELKRKKEKERYNALTLEEKREKGRKANERAKQRKAEQRQQIKRLTTRVKTLEEKLSLHRKRSYGDDILLDLLPLRMFLLRQARIYGSSGISRRVGYDEAFVRRHLNGYFWETECHPVPVYQVTLGVVDTYVTRLDTEVTLDDLYPELTDLLDERLARN